MRFLKDQVFYVSRSRNNVLLMNGAIVANGWWVIQDFDKEIGNVAESQLVLDLLVVVMMNV